MIVYRIAKTIYIKDLSGTGSRIYGGRWNKKGVSIVYTSATRALAVLEYLVHVPLSLIPEDLSIASINVPDNIKIKELSISDLPLQWNVYPAPLELAEIGNEWAISQESLLLRVPSVIVEPEFNYLINPIHPEMKKVTLTQVNLFTLDDRLLQ